MIKIINSGSKKFFVLNAIAYERTWDDKTLVMFSGSTFQNNDYIFDISIKKFESFLFGDDFMVDVSVTKYSE